MKNQHVTAGSTPRQSLEPWISVAEVASHLGIKRDTIYKWLERGRIPAHKVGRLWKFKASEVDKWVESGKAKAK